MDHTRKQASPPKKNSSCIYNLVLFYICKASIKITHQVERPAKQQLRRTANNRRPALRRWHAFSYFFVIKFSKEMYAQGIRRFWTNCQIFNQNVHDTRNYLRALNKWSEYDSVRVLGWTKCAAETVTEYRMIVATDRGMFNMLGNTSSTVCSSLCVCCGY